MVIKELYNSDAQFHDEQYSIFFFYQTSMALKHGETFRMKLKKLEQLLVSSKANGLLSSLETDAFHFLKKM
jgi:hypothetical protein